MPDRRDANPLAPPLDAPDDVAAIRQALFTFHVATSNDCTAVVVARGEDESLQEYRGYAGYTLASRGGRKGFANIVRIDVNIESPTQATVDYGEWHGIVHGFGFHARLKKVGGKWLIILHRNTWVS